MRPSNLSVRRVTQPKSRLILGRALINRLLEMALGFAQRDELRGIPLGRKSFRWAAYSFGVLMMLFRRGVGGGRLPKSFLCRAYSICKSV